jgi:hypothetical protein
VCKYIPYDAFQRRNSDTFDWYLSKEDFDASMINTRTLLTNEEWRVQVGNHHYEPLNYLVAMEQTRPYTECIIRSLVTNNLKVD